MGDHSTPPFLVSRYDNTFSKVDCNQKGYVELPDGIFILKSVSHLSASGNKIVMINPKICNLWQLKSLDLSTNCITSVAPEIGLLCCLNLLSLQFNAFRQVPVQLCMLSNLRVLRLEGNLQLQYIPCELALCTQLLQLHADGCTSLKFPRAQSVFGKPPVVPWLTHLKHDASMNVMNYLKAMLAITALCATGGRRVADFSEICGADLQALGQFEVTPWHRSTEGKCASMTIKTDSLLPFLSEEITNKDFEQQASRVLSISKSYKLSEPDFEEGSLESAINWLKKRFPQICCQPIVEQAIALLENTPVHVDRAVLDSFLRKILILHRVCTVLSIWPTDESGFSLYEELGQACVAARLSKLQFYCNPDISVPRHRNDIFERIPATFADLIACLKYHDVIACHAFSTIEFSMDGRTLFQQNKSAITELKFNHTGYFARGDIACALPYVQCINIDFNSIPKLKLVCSSTRLHTLSLKSCECREITISDANPIKLEAFCLSKNDLIEIDASFQYVSRTVTWLDLSHNKLLELPSMLESFLELKYLNCSNNFIQLVSVNFKHLRKLKCLNLSDNKITEINEGLLQFATESAGHTNLECQDVVLDLNGNLITHLPTGPELNVSGKVSPFKYVTKLLLGYNPFSVLHSDFFLMLEKLQTMDFHNFKNVAAPTQPVLLSGIAGVRRWFSLVAQCKETGHLDLRGYQLASIEEAVLEECLDLTSIDLSNNAFAQVPLELNLLVRNMHTLIFDNNCLASASDVSCFPPELSSLTLLRLISVQRCGLTKLPETIFTLEKLCILKLCFNPITCLHPKLCMLSSLKELDVHGCPISFPQPSIMNSTLSVVMAFLKTCSRDLFKHELPLREQLQCCHIDYDWEMLQIQWNGCGPAPVPLRCQHPSQDLMVSEHSVIWVRNRELRQEWNFSHFPLPCVTENTFWETCTSPFPAPDVDQEVLADIQKKPVCVCFDAKPLYLVRTETLKTKQCTLTKRVATLSNCGIVFTDIPKLISESLLQLCLSFNENLSRSWINNEGHLSLPATIRSMTSLRVLCLRSCKFDSIPSGLEFLQSLVDLDLSFNNIFTIPVEMRTLKELRRLVLDSNPLHAWPPALRSFARLELLSMQKCRLREISSTHMQTLTSMTSLRLDLNLFNSFPSVYSSKLRALSINSINIAPASLSCLLQNSFRLRMLSLSRCKLRCIPSEISYASSLVDLSIDDNDIMSLPYSFGMCVSMYRLQISENQIRFPPVHLLQKDTIQNGLTLLRAFEEAVFSKTLVLDCVPLEFIPSDLSNIQTLTSISACECGLLNFGDCLELLPNLSSIFFNTNLIHRLPWYIKDMTSLKTLELFHNPLEFPPLEYFLSHTLDEVRTFVSACFTASQEGFISLSYKSFENVPSYVFYCDSITSLDLSHNFLDTIPDSFIVFTSLNTLNISYNKLSFINPILATISTLRVINTSGNILHNVPIQVLDINDSGDYLLVYLNALLRASIILEENYLASQLKLDAIDGNTGPVFVGFTFDAGNAFKTVTFSTSIPLVQIQSDDKKCYQSDNTTDASEVNWFSRKLKSSSLSPYAQGQLFDMIEQQLTQNLVDIRGANLLLIPQPLCSKLLGANILEIRLDNNELTVLPVYLFESTTHLRTLSARSNWLISIPVQATKLCPKIAFFDFAHNRFDSAPSHLNECKSLTFLDLSNNCVKFLCSDCFAKCTSLTDLHLNFNPIEALPSFWTDQHRIKYLGIQGCIKLRALPSTLALTKKLHELDICSATIEALQTPASYVWKGGFGAVRRFLSKICACVEGGCFDMSNMSVESLPLHFMSSTLMPSGHTCNQIDVGTSDARLVYLQKLLQQVKPMPILGLSISKIPTIRSFERKTSILDTAESLPPGYDLANMQQHVTNEESNQIIFDEYVAAKQKIVPGDSVSSATKTLLMAILPSALVLDFNPLLNMSLSPRQCEDVCSMSMNDCGLTDLPSLLPSWDNLTSLHTISLDNNLFKTPPSYGLGQLGPSLTQLSMSGCRLEAFPDILLLKLPFLRYLNVESNGLNEIPDTISCLTCLTHLKMSENHFSVINFDVFANTSLNEFTVFQQKHIHTKLELFFKFMDGIASRRGNIDMAWNRVYTWSAADSDNTQPWIFKHLEPMSMLPITIPVEFQSEENSYTFKDVSSWELLRKDWQRQVRMNMLPI